MNPDQKRWLWRGVKLCAALVVLVFVGVRFWRDLERLDFNAVQLRPGWLLASGGLYLLGTLPQAWFWRHVLGVFGYPVSVYGALRANLISQLGKYVPGKALAVLMRAHLVHCQGVPYGVSVISTIYEVFTGMAAGAMIACLVFVIDPPALVAGFKLHPALMGSVLIALCGIPLMPGVFNFVIARLTARIQALELYRLPPVRFNTLGRGLLATGAGWWLQGLSVWAMFQAVVPEPRELTLSWWAQCTAAIAFASVAGFVAFFLPAGFGVREGLLLTLLGESDPPDPHVAVGVILLRLDWIIAEALFTLCTYWIKPAGARSELAGATNADQTIGGLPSPPAPLPEGEGRKAEAPSSEGEGRKA